MEFKYRAVDKQPPPPPTSSSAYCYITEQDIRAGYASPGSGKANKCISKGSGQAVECFRNANYDRETIQRELEKERIREEMDAAEWRQALEAEVRMERMLDRKLATRARGGDEGGLDRFSFRLGGGKGFEPSEIPFQQAMGQSLDEKIAMLLEERSGTEARRDSAGFDVVPPQQGSLEPKNKEVTLSPLDVGKGKDKIILRSGIGTRRDSVGSQTVPLPQGNLEPKTKEVSPFPLDFGKGKDKIILLAKPDVLLSGAKRKAVSPKEECANELLSIDIAKKNMKEEWSCAICHVSATSERALNDHIQGKKHKSKEDAMRGQKDGQKIGIGVFPKKAVKPVVEVTHSLSSEQGLNSGGQLLQLNEIGESSLNDCLSKGCLNASNVSSLQENDKTDNLKSKNLGVQKDPNKGQKEKKKFTFWCEMCQVGAYNENVMAEHKKGKKHRARLEKARENGKSIPTPQVVGVQVVNDSDEATKKGDDGKFENADGTINEQDRYCETARRDADDLD